MPAILIIDDDSHLRDSLRRTLRKGGYDVIEAADGGEGLKKMKERAPDVVLLDIFMPGKEGLETISDLRRANPSAHVIAMSGGGQRGGLDVLRVARMLGARRSLTKPFSPEQLLEAVREELSAGEP